MAIKPDPIPTAPRTEAGATTPDVAALLQSSELRLPPGVAPPAAAVPTPVPSASAASSTREADPRRHVYITLHSGETIAASSEGPMRFNNPDPTPGNRNGRQTIEAIGVNTPTGRFVFRAAEVRHIHVVDGVADVRTLEMFKTLSQNVFNVFDLAPRVES